ncbi:retrovirus-related pol polyprotein from transposon TNT 1-94 [Tanacetum coccineum]
MEKLKSENVSLEFQVQSLIKERENVKTKYQKLFDSIKRARFQTQGEINELIENVNQKTYAYADVHAQNQDLLITIFELKAKLKNAEKGKSVNTKFDKYVVSNNLLGVTPSHKQVFQKKIATPKTEEKHNSSEKVEVSDRSNKKLDVASKHVDSNKKIVINDDIKNALIAKNVLCVSCAKNVLIPCHDNCLAKYKLNVHSKVRRALFTTSRIVKSKFEDPTPVVSKTRFSVKSVQSQSLDTTLVVSKTKIVAVTPLSAKNKVVQIILWIVDSGCSKHMTGDRSLLKNFIEKFTGTVRFGNDHFTAITGYGDYVQDTITVCHVYYVEGLGYNLISVGHFCDDDLEVVFRSNTCYMQNMEGDDMLIGDRESNLYTISIADMATSSPVSLMSKATLIKSWLWHRRLAHLNFSTINDLTKHDLVDGLPKFKYEKDHLCSACERGKRKKASHPPKLISNETLEIIKNFIAQVQLNYNAKVCKIRIDNGTEFKNATIKAQYDKLGIMQQVLIARTPQQNVSTACFTQNRSIIHTRYNKTPYELFNGRKPNVEYFHVFGLLCYPTNDRDNLGKMKPKADIGIFISYSKTSRGFRIYNRRAKKIMKTIHVKFDELIAMASKHDCLEPVFQRFINDDSSAESMNIPSKEDLDNLFEPMYEEYFEKRSSKTSINSITQQVHNHEDSPSTSSIIVEEHEAPPTVTTSEEQTSPISLNEADEFNQEDSTDFDGNTVFVPYDVPNFEEAESSTIALDP